MTDPELGLPIANNCNITDNTKEIKSLDAETKAYSNKLDVPANENCPRIDLSTRKKQMDKKLQENEIGGKMSKRSPSPSKRNKIITVIPNDESCANKSGARPKNISRHDSYSQNDGRACKSCRPATRSHSDRRQYYKSNANTDPIKAALALHEKLSIEKKISSEKNSPGSSHTTLHQLSRQCSSETPPYPESLIKPLHKSESLLSARRGAFAAPPSTFLREQRRRRIAIAVIAMTFFILFVSMLSVIATLFASSIIDQELRKEREEMFKGQHVTINGISSTDVNNQTTNLEMNKSTTATDTV